MKLLALAATAAAVAGCAQSQVVRPDTPSLYRSSRHVNVVVTRGGRTVHVGGQGPGIRREPWSAAEILRFR
jgi:hypothetical protein